MFDQPTLTVDKGSQSDRYGSRSALACRHCGEALTPKADYWTHAHGLYRCQRAVEYGHNAAHPDIPCKRGGPNPCRCTNERGNQERGD